MSCLGKRFAHVTRYIRSLRGGSQPILAEASDGEVYVVKFADKIRGPNLLFNEVAGTELYRAFGLPVARWRPLLVTGDFLDENPACWPRTPEGLHRPASGMCFGSLFLGGASVKSFEVLPGSHFQRVRNHRDFWLAWLVDVCASHSDSRQAIFVEKESRELKAVFIDFGHMFGGPKGDQHPPGRASRYLDKRIYLRSTASSIVTVRRIAGNLDSDRLWRQLVSIPGEWQYESAQANFAACLNRLSDSRLLENTLDLLAESFGQNARERACSSFVRHPPVSILSPGLQAKGRIRNAVA